MNNEYKILLWLWVFISHFNCGCAHVYILYMLQIWLKFLLFSIYGWFGLTVEFDKGYSNHFIFTPLKQNICYFSGLIQRSQKTFKSQFIINQIQIWLLTINRDLLKIALEVGDCLRAHYTMVLWLANTNG